MRLLLSTGALTALLLFPAASAQDPVISSATAPFPSFESGPVRALLLSPDGATLFALNTPDARVEVYDTGADTPTGLRHRGSIFTGLEPVSMALHPEDPGLLFVANLLSDSVSVIDLVKHKHVATIPVGDEPQDVLVAEGKLFVATARAPGAPGLDGPAGFVDNAVVIASADAPYDILDRVEIPAHKPRALALRDGIVHVLPLNSGNHTVTINEFTAESLGIEQLDLDAFDEPFDVNMALLAPQLSQGNFNNNGFGTNMWEVPVTGRIVFDSEYPGLGPDVMPQLPDNDIVMLDAASGALLPDPVTSVGTSLLALAVNPLTGDLWVANTDARNRTRFEPAIAGRAFDNRVTVVTGNASDHGNGFHVPLEPPLTSRSHAQPAALAFHDDGHGGGIAYIAALGTATVVALDAVTGELVAEIDTGEVPVGLAVDDESGLLYVLSRVDKDVRTYDIAAGHALAARAQPLAYDPEPQGVDLGRRHLYDARTSTGAGNGNMSCASCHIFGHTDALAWDLGNPEGGLGWFYTDLMSQEVSFGGTPVAAAVSAMTHPMKGPMLTQTLRGLGDFKSPPLHWRGDRRFFHMFRGAFVGLLGGEGITPRAIQEYAAFVRSLDFPPNPLQPKDREYAGGAASGRTLFGLTEGVPGKVYNPLIPNVRCRSCHEANFADKLDFTGSQRTVNFDAESQMFNSAGLRGLYERVYRDLTGYGLSHDGAIDDVFEFLSAEADGLAAFPLLTDQDRLDIEEFVLQWDSGMAPLVGEQFTATATNVDALLPWLELAESQATPPESNVDLVVHLSLLQTTAPRVVGAHFRPDAATEGVGDGFSYLLDVGLHLPREVVVDAIAGGVVDATFTIVPPGTGGRFGVDRDEDDALDGLERALGLRTTHPDTDRDGYADGLELDLESDPRDASSLPDDRTAPEVLLAQTRDVFADTATLHVVASEPVRARVGISLAGSDGDALADFESDGRRRRHDLILDGLPAGESLAYSLTITDTAGLATVHAGAFQTAPPMLHVADMTIDKQDGGDGSILVSATVTVVDHEGNPVPGVPVRGIWQGGFGPNWWFPTRDTDADGVALFGLNPIAPAGASTVTFSPAYIGSTAPANPYFVGSGGQSPTFFYNQSVNAVNSVSVDLP